MENQSLLFPTASSITKKKTEFKGLLESVPLRLRENGGKKMDELRIDGSLVGMCYSKVQTFWTHTTLTFGL